MTRLDVLLCSKGFYESRTKAQRAIENGLVTVDGIIAAKASECVPENAVIEISVPMCGQFVGRAGQKLSHALDFFKIDVSGFRAVDIGASTGGFTQSLLDRGASFVYAVDVGKGQLHPSISEDKRVESIEGFNARNLDLTVIGGIPVDIVVMDVSFISQTLLHKVAFDILKHGGFLISLIKPQFELTKADIGKNGIVKSDEKRKRAVDRVLSSAASLGFNVIGVTDSPILGGSGNKEYLMAQRKN